MKIISLSAILFFSIISSGQTYRTQQPFIYNGQVYSAFLNVIESDNNPEEAIIISINFYVLRPASGNIKQFENFGGYCNVRRTFAGASLNDKAFSLLPKLSSPGSDGFCRFNRCKPKFSNNKLEVVLSEYNEFNNFKVHFEKVNSTLLATQESGFDPGSYMDEVQENRLKSTPVLNNSIEISNSSNSANFNPVFLGDIDSKEFPLNDNLLNFLKNNSDFIFRLSKDFYLDILRFKANMYEYDEEKIANFLKAYDLRYMQYQFKAQILQQKISGCFQLLKKAVKLINLGDIFYKEFAINNADINLESCHFEFTSLSQKENNFSFKKLRGEDDPFYQANGLCIYLSNWESLKKLNLSDAHILPYLSDITGNPRPVTYRVYFLLQPFPAFSEEGDFKGIMAYGLKAMLYNPCTTEPLLAYDNSYLENIADTVVKRCYKNGINYLNKYFKKNGSNADVHIADLYRDNFEDLGNWHQPLPNCEVSNVYLAGKIINHSDNEKVLSIRLMTNYKAIFQSGNKVVLSNANSGVSYSMPMSNASIHQTGSKSGYFNLEIIIPNTTYSKLLRSNVNNISFQCKGEPEFQIPHTYFYSNPNVVITNEVDNIQLSFSINSVGDAPQFIGFLRRGL